MHASINLNTIHKRLSVGQAQTGEYKANLTSPKDATSKTVSSPTEPKADKELLSCPFDEAPSAEDKTDSSDPIIPVPCSLNQDTAATSADNSLSADETLEAEDSPETDNVSVSISPESASVIEHRDHPVD
uniref:Uncharacterized protein n=1 Tax=Lactuca sativa TaxID=4236 RepID=A0A9R1VFH1_LACSA|nr:hypothetical protein LSAT_V11C500256550 [Lactuca sativa]